MFYFLHSTWVLSFYIGLVLNFLLKIVMRHRYLWHVPKSSSPSKHPGCQGIVSRALQNILSNFVYCRSRTSYANFKLTLCTCAQSHALGTCTKFQLEMFTINVISSIVYFREIVLESSWYVGETPPRCDKQVLWRPPGCQYFSEMVIIMYNHHHEYYFWVK